MASRLKYIAVLGVAGFAIFWLLTQPKTISSDALTGLDPDLDQGKLVYTAAGCASCHSAKDTTGEVRDILTGGQAFVTQFGTFIAPNISPDPEFGIGSWDTETFINAVMYGTSPKGQHYFPAFPYATYGNMTLQDAVSLRGYMNTLAPSAQLNPPHDLSFPFSIRQLVGGWKFLFGNAGWVVLGDLDAQEIRGRYLVEALGHCAECHTPRNMLGGLTKSRWLSGAPNPSGKGKTPNITPAALTWDEEDIVEYLTSGFTPEYDSAGGTMVEVIENTSALPKSDRVAIARYLKRVAAMK